MVKLATEDSDEECPHIREKAYAHGYVGYCKEFGKSGQHRQWEVIPLICPTYYGKKKKNWLGNNTGVLQIVLPIFYRGTWYSSSSSAASLKEVLVCQARREACAARMVRPSLNSTAVHLLSYHFYSFEANVDSPTLLETNMVRV